VIKMDWISVFNNKKILLYITLKTSMIYQHSEADVEHEFARTHTHTHTHTVSLTHTVGLDL
jgi:metal-responsive CopG/Arc/MetJ family transcriptional regulator